MKLPSPGFLLEAFALVLRRFPATMFCAFAGVTGLFVLIEDYAGPRDWIRTVMVAILGLPLLTGVVAYGISAGWKEQRRLLWQGIALVPLIAYWFWLQPKTPGFDYRDLPGYMTLVLVAHLFVAVAPFLNNRSVRDFWEYNKQLFASIVIGVAFTFILFAGLSLAILAVDQLFDLDLKEKIYLRLFFVLAGIFNTAFFLFQFPTTFSYEAGDNTYNALFKNLCKYILIPIVALYFLFLYAYSFKILGAWSLPRGWVGSLVTGFSVAGIFTYLLNFYLPEQDTSKLVSGYKRWFWWVLLPLTVLLGIAIGRRISDYGVTEMRFLVAQMGVWLALISLYFLLSKKDNIKFIPISLALFALTWAFGPLSAKAVSERSQLGRIKQVLEQTGRLEAGKMKPGKTPATSMESEQFESAVYFLEQRDRLDALQDMLPMSIDSLPEAPGYYGVSGRLRAWVGLGSTTAEAAQQKQINVYTQTPLVATDVRGYATFKPIALNKSSKVDKTRKGIDFQLSADGTMLEWVSSDGNTTTIIEKFDLLPLMKTWAEMRTIGNNYIELEPIHSTTNFVGTKGSIRLILENAMAEMDEEGLSMSYLNGYVFVK
jgi:hypothetical protein